jgi:hypothetical protein
MSKAKLITPYGGKLVNLVAEGKEREELLARAPKLPSIKITMRNLCDLELIATGGFSPLTTFMGKADYERVLHEMRLADGTLFPLPITLTADPKELPTVGEDIVLRNVNNDVIAILTLDEVFHWDADRSRACIRLHRPASPDGLRNGALGQGLHLRADEGRQPSQVLRFRQPAPHPRPGARNARSDGTRQRGRVPDPQPPAPHPRRIDQARRRAGERLAYHPPSRRHDQAR